MRCPFCGHDDTQVKDSRPTEDNSAIRRRRFCPACGSRFTTFERVQLRELVVVKGNGQREPFEREKLLRSMQISLRKRPVDAERLERVVNGIVRRLESSGEPEIQTSMIGEAVMDALANLDKVALTDGLNRLVAEDRSVEPRWITDEEMAEKPELVRTMSVKPPSGHGKVRLLDIAGVDLQPCGGTHVARTGEIGAVEVTKIESKGKMNKRVNIAFKA